MLIYDTHRHCLVSEAGIPQPKAAPLIHYGIAHALEILLLGASPASAWSCSVDTDLDASSTPMCRTVSGIEAEETPDGVRLAIPLETRTQTFRAATEGRADGRLAYCGIYGYDSEGAARLYAQLPALCKFTVDAEGSGTVEPVSVTYLTQAQVQALAAGEVGGRFASMTFTAHDDTEASASYDPETNSADFGLPSARWGGITGDISDQTDLQNALDAKQDKLPDYPATHMDESGLPLAGKAEGGVEYRDAESLLWNRHGVRSLGDVVDDIGTIAQSALDSASSKVSDVKVNGTSVVTDGVAAIPIASDSALGVVKTRSLGIVTNTNNGEIRIYPSNNSGIDNKGGGSIYSTYCPIVPNNLDYAVRSVLPNVTTIPAATTAYSLLDASANTNSHSMTYEHAPSAAPIYTLPAVTDTTTRHRISLTVTFSASALSCAFQDAVGTTIAPKGNVSIAAGSIVEYLCEYVAGGWVIYALQVKE